MPEQQLQKSPKTDKMAFTNGVGFHLSELVSERMVTAFTSLLNYFADSLVYSVVFNDKNLPVDHKSGKAVYSSYCIPVRSIVINLQKNFDAALDIAQSKDNVLSLNALIWLQILLSFAHEIKHGIDLGMCTDEASFTVKPEDCETAQEWAYSAIMEAAASGRCNLEMPDMLNEPFISELYMAAYDVIDKGESDWEKLQSALLSDGLAYRHDGFACESFMDYLQHLNAGEFPWIDIILEADPEPAGDASEQVQTLATELVAGAETLTVAPAPATPAPHENLATPAPAVVETSIVAEAGEAEMIIDPSLVFDADELPVNEIPVETTVAPHGLTADQAQGILAQVMARMMAHVMNKCQPVVGNVPDNQNIQGFGTPMGILDPCFIGDIEGVGQLIVSYDCVDPTGAVIQKHIPLFGEDADGRKTVPDGHIKGVLNKAEDTPSFVFYINANGFLQKRSFRMQNVNKRQGTELKKWAKEARSGAGIALVYRDLTDAQKAADESSVIMTVKRMPGMTSTVTTFNPFDAQWAKEVPVG